MLLFTGNLRLHLPPIPLKYIGLYLKNNSTGGAAGEPEESEQSPYSLNIINNTFTNGCASIILANYLSNVLPYSVTRNVFNNTASVNFIGIQISGKIKNNSFTSSNVPLGIHLVNSHPDLYNNIVNSKDVSLHLAGLCNPNLAPYIFEGNMIWTGGKNSLDSDEGDNVQLSSAGKILTDWGNNNFSVSDSTNYHIYGWMDSSINSYYARDNCWNSSDVPIISLTKNNSSFIVPIVYYNLGYNCVTEANATGWNITNMGNGIYDSVKLSYDITGEELSDLDQLYYMGESYFTSGNYPNAITTLKSLVDSEDSYSYHSHCFVLLYDCYVSLDTSADESYTIDLYTDLIDYLENKIELEDCGDVDMAMVIIAQCYANIEEYTYTSNTYELLALYHPDPNIRLLASWNYEEIQDLINSGSGGGNQNIEVNEYKLIERIEKIINDDPLMSKVKKVFDNEQKKKLEVFDKQIKESVNNPQLNESFRQLKEFDKLKEERAKSNLLLSRSLNSDEKAKRRLEDISITAISTSLIRDNSMGSNLLPFEYSLSQNYPNPFNPSTKINFDLPVDGKANLVIYDMLGREIMKLVNNELKTAGRYTIEFNGVNFASGVYFYRLEVNNFVQTKRMVLLK